MKTMEGIFEKVLIYENEKDIQDFSVRVKSAVRAYNILYNAYLALLPTGIHYKVEEVSDLFRLAYDPEGEIRRSYLAKLPATFQIEGINIKREAIDSHIDMPDITGLIEASNQFRRASHPSGEQVSNFDLYQISGEEVIINEVVFDEEKNTFRMFAATEEEIANFEFLSDLCDKLNEAVQRFGIAPSAQIQEQLKCIRKKGTKYLPDPQYVKRKIS